MSKIWENSAFCIPKCENESIVQLKNGFLPAVFSEYLSKLSGNREVFLMLFCRVYFLTFWYYFGLFSLQRIKISNGFEWTGMDWNKVSECIKIVKSE